MLELKETLFQVRDGIAIITLNRPDMMNAFNLALGRELEEIFAYVDGEDSIRAAVVTGSGKAFCAGADLSVGISIFDVISREGKTGLLQHRDEGGKVALAIWNCRKPVIGAINGAAVGVGITMTLAMDMRIAAKDAKIGFVFTRRGVVPEACSSWFLPRIVGPAKAMELVYTGRVFRAEAEANSGLFNYVLPKEEVLPKALSIAEEIAQNTSSFSVCLSKALLKQGLSEEDPHSMHLTDSKYFGWAGSQKDAVEGVMSFLEKRPPRFSMSPTKDVPDFYLAWQEEQLKKNIR